MPLTWTLMSAFVGKRYFTEYLILFGGYEGTVVRDFVHKLPPPEPPVWNF